MIRVSMGCTISDLKVLEDAMGWWHSYYAKACLDAGVCKCVSLEVDEIRTGVGLYYTLATYPPLGVIYYIAIVPKYRGRSLGRVLIASIEQLLEDEGAQIYLATTTLDNEIALQLFTSMGYTVLKWREIWEWMGYDLYDLLVRATCGYEDDVVMLKCLSCRSIDAVLKKLINRHSMRAAENVWYRICYEPWRRMRST